MKKSLLIYLLGWLTFSFADAQTTCRVDTTYNYKFIDGSTTKTLTGRTIDYPGSDIQGIEQPTPRLVQDFKNNTWVNNSKREVSYNAAGYYTEYKVSIWDSASAAWVLDYQENVTYDAGNRWLEYAMKETNGGTLVNTFKALYEYNPAGKQTKYHSFNWDNVANAWINQVQTLSTYNASNLAIEVLTQAWDAVASAWVNSERTLFDYNASGKEIFKESYTWDAGASAWKGIESSTTTYDAQGYLAELTVKSWDLGSNSFINLAKRIETHSTNGNLLTREYQNWVHSLSEFKRAQYITFTYDANNEQTGAMTRLYNTTTGIAYSAQRSTITLNAAKLRLMVYDEDSSASTGGIWRDFRKWTYTYDANNNKTAELYQVWNNADNALRNVQRTTQTFNSNNQLLQTTLDYWGATSGSWVPGTDLLNEYDNNGFRTASEFKSNWNATGTYYDTHNRYEYICTLVSVGIENMEDYVASIYPNPIARGSELLVDVAQSADFILVDFFGRVLRRGHFNSGNNTLNTTELSTGFYLLHFSGRSFKVVIQ